MSSSGIRTSGRDAAPAEFDFKVSSERQLLEIRLSGLWDMATAERYADERRRVFDDMSKRGCPPEDMRLLVDRSDQTVQTAPVVAKLDAIVAEGSAVRRTAVIVSSMLHKLQAQRVGTPGPMGVFLTRESAIAWLLEIE